MKRDTPSYRGYRFPPEIISHAVWLYHRFCLSFRDVEDLLAQRSIAVSYEAIRLWCIKFGPEYDARGMQAGAIWVMEPYDPSHENEGSDRHRGVDIRVDDSPDPFKELRRLLNITLGWRHSRMSRRLAGEGKFTEAIEAQKKALTYNQADNVIYGLAQRYAQAGDVANALENLREAIAQNPRWKAVAARNTSFDKIKDHPEFKALIERE